MPDTAQHTHRVAVAPLARRLLAEFLGTGLLVAVVIGSGIAAQQLSPTDVGVQLLQNSLTTVFGLGVLILLFGPVSGAHFNPVVSAVDWAIGRRVGTGLTGTDLAAYTVAQVLGGIGGALLANTMFGLAAMQISQHVRAAPGLWVGEIVATAGLIALILTLARTGRASLSAAAVAAWIGAAYWFTSSTSFANPAVTIARMFSDTFAGVAPTSVPLFVVFQCLGAALGAGLTLLLYPDTPDAADDVLVPHTTDGVIASTAERNTRQAQIPSPNPQREPTRARCRRCCSCASTTPDAHRWRPPCCNITPRAGSRSAPPDPHRPTRSTPPFVLPWPRSASTSRAPTLTDRILIFGERHLQAVLARYSAHYNYRRPHRALRLVPPRTDQPAPDVSQPQIRRRPILGGLINEYERGAA